MTLTILTPEPWAQEALCAETDPELFFPEHGDNAHAARQVCASCDVVAECLAYALRTVQTEGVWGGKTPRQLAKLRRRTNHTNGSL